ncbi:uncharacterized protein PV07_05159 [Cladophialophora immunda]|uniref:Ankyrin repeat domain-containing protein n=1 Tax=Cladophialophora immunda TaxID=569365 RepID=A0A0D2CGK1_9EURO|nr:uncharacterized protein PV07_05159 [Cladophialophora immunda]KIW29340.1 hypothetical protein PV07_05159 [Cladophialophora immunda]
MPRLCSRAALELHYTMPQGKAMRAKSRFPRFIVSLGVTEETRAKDFNDNIPLAVAVNAGHVKVVETILRTAQVSPKVRNEYKELLFHNAVAAGDIDMVNVFLESGASAEWKGKDNERALHVAARAGNAPVVRLLLKHGAAPKVKDSGLCTPLEIARGPEVIMLLREAESQVSKGKGKPQPKTVLPPPPAYSSSAK